MKPPTDVEVESADEAKLPGRGLLALPKVTIGIPVFNGARFIERAIRCFLNQDFDDLEVIVADNASTDSTLEICLAVASTDPRVQILTSESNRGAAPNFNRLVGVASGKYFKWAAHDDWCSGDFVAATVDALESCVEGVLCYTPMAKENEEGHIVRWRDQILPELRSDDVRRRYREIIWNLRDPTQLIFGLLRTDVLRRTGRIPNSPEPDRLLLNELVLHGPVLRVSGPTFVWRAPPGHMYHYADDGTPLRRRSWVWLHADNAGRPKVSTYRVLKSNLANLDRAPNLTRSNRFALTIELLFGMLVTRLRSKLRRTFRRARSQLRAVVPGEPNPGAG